MKKTVVKINAKKLKKKVQAMRFKEMKQKTFQRTLERQFYRLPKQIQNFLKSS